MPLLAALVDAGGHGSAYGSVYAIAQTAVSLAYGLGPLFGGKLSETFGFPNVISMVGAANLIYVPLLYFLRQSATTKDEAKMTTELQQLY